MKKSLMAVLALFTSCFLFSTTASADVTGDFKVLTATYTGPGDATGGDVTVAGSVNHGAVQSGKKVAVDVTFDYSFEYQILSSTGSVTCVKTKKNGQIQVIGEGACSNSSEHDGAYNLNTTVTSRVVVPANGMKAVTTAVVTKDGRLNPKGKITGYDWNSVYSIVPVDSVVDPLLIPSGATLVSGSVRITGVEFSAYLVETDLSQIADTVTAGILFPAP